MALTTRTYSDLDLSFRPHPVTGDVLKRKNENAIAGSLRNLLSTAHYERLFQPDIGCNLKRMLFEPLDDITATTINDEIKTTIGNYEPRVSISELRVSPNYDDNRYDVTLEFYIVNDPDPITISFFLERVR